MDGVRILYTFTEDSPIMALWVILSLAAFLTTVALLFSDEYRVWAIVSLLFLGLFIGFCINSVTTPRYERYKVILEEGTSYSDLVRRYDVVGIEGEILTVSEKDTEEED